MSIIEMQYVSFKYDKRLILQNISLMIRKGEFLGVIGPNGSGKTTLLRIIDGILFPQEGDVWIKRRLVASMKRAEIARSVAFVPQDSSLIFPVSVLELVLMGRSPHLGILEFEGKKDFEIARDVMEMTDTLQFANRSVDELSGGERQRVLVARALAQESEIILLDESTAYLDIRYQIEVFKLMKSLNRDKGLSVVAVTHDINLASFFCDRIMLLNEGGIYSIGTPREVITESNIREVYKTDVLVDSNPVNGLPRITPLA